jgi:hypothetical protein
MVDISYSVAFDLADAAVSHRYDSTSDTEKYTFIDAFAKKQVSRELAVDSVQLLL